MNRGASRTLNPTAATLKPPRNITISYWAVTGFLALLMLTFSLFNLINLPEVVETLNRLGYPLYFLERSGPDQPNSVVL